MDADLVINGVSTVAVIYFVLEALKLARLLQSEQAPIAALATGVVVSLAFWLVPDVTSVIVRGIALGGAASVGYAGVKKAARETGGSASGARTPGQDFSDG